MQNQYLAPWIGMFYQKNYDSRLEIDGLWRTDKYLWMMEYFKMGNLEHLLTKYQLPIRFKLKVALDISLGMEFIGKHLGSGISGFRFESLKPSNILVKCLMKTIRCINFIQVTSLHPDSNINVQITDVGPDPFSIDPKTLLSDEEKKYYPCKLGTILHKT